MNILVLLAGVADNRYPLHEIALAAGGELEESGQTRRILSPFDEGALELALKLRDKNNAVKIDVLLMDGPNAEALGKTVAAYKPDSLKILGLEPCHLWDAALTSGQIAEYVKARGLNPALVFVGREFGDLDEGSIPVMLAGALGLPYFSLTQFAEWQGDEVRLMRERGMRREWLPLKGACLATVTNDKRNKLRHPLMKNVMMAKRQAVESDHQTSTDSGKVVAKELADPKAVARTGQCEMLGGSVQEQAQAIARFLKQATA